MYSKSKPIIKRALAGVLLSLVLGGVAPVRLSAATSAEEKARGEEMLKKAHVDMAQARQMQEDALKLSQTAQHDMATANMNLGSTRNSLKTLRRKHQQRYTAK